MQKIWNVIAKNHMFSIMWNVINSAHVRNMEFKIELEVEGASSALLRDQCESSKQGYV